MIIAGIDFETTSVDPETCYPTEFAIMLWDPVENLILDSMSFLITVPKRIDINNWHITGLTREYIDTYGLPWHDFEKELRAKIQYVHYIMAHNAVFDRTILERMLDATVDLKWIDTMTDLPYPSQITTRSLTHLAAEHGFLNPFPHRALFDVATMIKIASMYDITEILKYARSPNVWIRASVSKDDRGKAKNRYYKWDPTNGFWVKQLKELNILKEETEADFPIDLLPGYIYKEQYL